ncbi:MAG: immunoglobulin domain-containing protein [Verrucomicrobiaceae bacterium]|nr:immunoglobulin domain-containing protein [Verrucomicrobiaceae bacterium]
MITRIRHFLTSSATLLLFTTLGAHGAVSITTPPQASTKLAGDLAVFTVQATGTGTLTYQWKKDGTDIDGAT